VYQNILQWEIGGAAEGVKAKPLLKIDNTEVA
jgi:hypothetical protein